MAQQSKISEIIEDYIEGIEQEFNEMAEEVFKGNRSTRLAVFGNSLSDCLRAMKHDILRHLEMNQARRINRNAREEAMRSIGMVKTAYGWE